MPLDFRMKHEGEPPARLVAQLRMRLKEKGHPPMLAEILAPVMESEDDLDEDILAQITLLVQSLERSKVPGDEAMAAIREVVEDLIAASEDPGEEDEEDISAWYPQNRDKPKSKLLSQLVREKLQSKRPKVLIDGRSPRPGGARMDRWGNTIGGMSHRDVLSDALLARIDRRHTPTIGREFAALSLGEMAMHVVRHAGHRPLNMQQAIRMATHTTSDFPLVLEDALNKSIARQMEQITPALARAAHEIPAVDYRSGNLLSLSASGMPAEIAEGGRGQARHDP